MALSIIALAEAMSAFRSATSCSLFARFAFATSRFAWASATFLAIDPIVDAKQGLPLLNPFVVLAFYLADVTADLRADYHRSAPDIGILSANDRSRERRQLPRGKDCQHPRDS
ncbi:hypothetical protein [Phyllobacterium sp. A18/5-2]|uniref:hypothetical protein n=1 Tax=Phyllobacterium sp. A18/5-2 TaxID=2978392 RepID=UPI0021C60802|nr:hypothetical protein [Phyllobacterium sp. A18/5-2]